MSTEQRTSRPRYTMVVVARVRELHGAGWTPTEIRRLVSKEFPGCSPTVKTIRRWFDPAYDRSQAETTERKNKDRQLKYRTRKMRELYLRGVSLRSIGQVTAMWWGDELSAHQVRSRLGLKAGDVARSLEGRRAA